jgi:hypothetical protein
LAFSWPRRRADNLTILMVQRADGGTESLRNMFLNMAESSTEK